LKLAPIDAKYELIPVCLPDDVDLPEFENKSCYATGYGSGSPNGDLLISLHETKLPVVSKEICQESYSKSESRSKVKIFGGHLCAGTMNGTSGTCVVSTSYQSNRKDISMQFQ